MPLISIIVPAYNPGPYLVLAVQSVIAQTYTDWELIVIDDGSTEELSGITALHPKITLLKQENRGVSVARNTGMLHAQGEFVAFLDADDLWAPEKLAKQIEVMVQYPSVGICHTLTRVINSNGEPGEVLFSNATSSYYDLLKICSIVLSSAIIRRDCLAISGMFDPGLFIAQDYDMWLKISNYYQISTIMSIETFYRIHGRNITRNYLLMYKEVSAVLHRRLQIARQHKDKRAVMLTARSVKHNRVGCGCRAFDAGRASLADDKIMCAKHLGYALLLAPQYVLKTVLCHSFRRKRVSHQN